MPRLPLIGSLLLVGSLAFASPSAAQLGLPDIGGVTTTVGQVVDFAGQTIGTVDPANGTVTDAVGSVIGTVDETTGTVVDAAGNVIGTVVPPAGTGTPPGDSGTAPQGPTPDTVSGVHREASPLRLTFSSRRTQRNGTVTRRGLTSAARCNRRCGVLVELRVTRRVAKALRLGSGRRSVRIETPRIANRGTVRTRMTTRARRAISRYLAAKPGRSVRVEVRAVAFDSAGTLSSVRRGTVTLKR